MSVKKKKKKMLNTVQILENYLFSDLNTKLQGYGYQNPTTTTKI